MVKQQTPRAVSTALSEIGEHLASWRRLRRLTIAEVADRAGLSLGTIQRIEAGSGATLENLLRVARVLGVLDLLTGQLDPYSTDLGRLRADEALPIRVRHRNST